MLTKTLRLYDSEKENIVADALSNHKNYGYDTERQMIVDCIYKSISGEHPSSTVSFDEEAFINKLLARLQNELRIDNASSHVTGNSPVTNYDSSSDTTNPDLDNALDFINGLF